MCDWWIHVTVAVVSTTSVRGLCTDFIMIQLSAPAPPSANAGSASCAKKERGKKK